MTVAVLHPLLPTTVVNTNCEQTHRNIFLVTHGTEKAVITSIDGAPVIRRSRVNEEDEAASDPQKIRAILDDPTFWAVAKALPGNIFKEGSMGRPPKQPTWVFLFVACVTAVLGSQRRAIAHLNDPDEWRRLVRFANARRPEQFDMADKKNLPKRHQLAYFHKRWSSKAWDKHVEKAMQEFRVQAAAAAKAAGLLSEDVPLRYNHVDGGQFVSYDGTVFVPASKSRPVRDKNKMAKRRVDPAAGWHGRHGDGDAQGPSGRGGRVWGSKVVFASTRSNDYHGRIIVDFEQVVGPTKTGVGDEAGSILTSVNRVQTLSPGMRGVIADSVLRGTHLQTLAAQGLVTVNYPHAKKNPNRSKEGRNGAGRIGKQHKVRVSKHTLENNTSHQHDIFVEDSVFYQYKYDDEGKLVAVEIPVIGYESRKNRSVRSGGTAETRFYLRLLISCSSGDYEISVPLYHDDQSDGGVQGFNRGEYIRFYPTNSVQFRLLYGRRNDTESLHRQIKIPLKKMPAYGFRKQKLYLLGVVIAHNAITRAHALKSVGLRSPFNLTT